jgi:hypothetical protein
MSKLRPDPLGRLIDVLIERTDDPALKTWLTRLAAAEHADAPPANNQTREELVQT